MGVPLLSMGFSNSLRSLHAVDVPEASALVEPWFERPSVSPEDRHALAAQEMPEFGDDQHANAARRAYAYQDAQQTAFPCSLLLLLTLPGRLQPPPQRYCQAIPTASKSLPVRVETPVLA